MSYIINLTNGNVLTTVQDGTTSTSTGLTLIGRNYTSYGDAQNQNFVKLLENFADTIPPTESSAVLTPLTGTLWYNTAENILTVYDGTNFNPVSQRIVANSTPTAVGLGDQWWDTTNNQLNAWTGTQWTLVGPPYSSINGLGGSLVENLLDSVNGTHNVIIDYASNVAVSITSSDPTFVLKNPQFGFDSIVTGLNVANNVSVGQTLSVAGNATFGNYATFQNPIIAFPQSGPAINPAVTNTYDIGTPSNTFRNVFVGGNVAFTTANIHYVNNSLILHNHAYQGNVDIFTSGWATTLNALHIDGNTGYVSVLNDPVSSNQVSTKNYVDTNIATVLSQLNTNIATLSTTTTNTFNTVISNTNANLIAAQALLNSSLSTTNTNLSNLTNTVNTEFASTTANAASQQATINTIISTLPTLALLNSPVFTGIPTAPNATPQTNSNVIATTAYVDASAGVITTNFTVAVAAEATSRASAIVAAVTGLAPTANPAFTGTPTAPTPTAGDNSTNIATTAFVEGQIAAQKFNYTVSANPPSGGNDGDFWFQIG